MKPREQQTKKNGPPSWARRLLQLCCPPSLFEELDGDLLEEFNYQCRQHGTRKASWDYALNVLSFIRPFAGRKKEPHQLTPLFSGIMWKNYLTTAVRNFSR